MPWPTAVLNLTVQQTSSVMDGSRNASPHRTLKCVGSECSTMLPLRKGSHIAVVGPMGVNQDLMSDYAGGTGEGGCWPKSDESCIVTIAAAIAAANTGGTTAIEKGCDVNSDSTAGFAAALDKVRAAA